MTFFRPSLLPAVVAFLVLPALLAAAPGKKGKSPVAVELVSDAAAIAPGQPFTVALRIQHEPHWHTYWIAPGTGLATALTWTLPEGFKAGEIQWPTPHVVQDTAGKITGNGYYDEVFLLVEIMPPPAFAPGAEVKLQAHAEWLMCSDVCMPGDAKLEITFPVAAAGAENAGTPWSPALAKARTQLPKPNTAWEVAAAHTATTATLRLAPKAGTKHQPKDLHFFAADGFTDYARPATVRPENGGWVLEMALDAAADPKTARLAGVLASANGWTDGAGYEGLVIDVPFEVGRVVPNAPPAGSQPPAAPAGSTSGSPLPAPSSLLGTLALAFVGGLVLNLMPCVFPVLGIKILGFVNQSGNDRRKIVLHGLVYTVGILVSFWLLAGVILTLRAGGQEIGWGAQMQVASFVFGMAAFLLLFALNLSGLFEIGLSATGAGASLQSKQGYAGSFFTGALAVLVATPCSAPFLAPALGAAFSSAFTGLQSIIIFTAIGLGLSTPYLLLSAFPQGVKLLPRPGAWMETFKQFMSFPLYATVGALLWVLAAQTKDDDNGLLLIAFGLVLVAMAAWLYGRFGQAFGKPGRMRFGRISAALLLAAGLWTGWPHAAEPVPAGSYQVTWEKWSPGAITAAQAAGKYVYVDFTARWCATCQTNKAAVFHSDAVLAELQKKNVVLLRGDWTNKDPAITAELARWNRSAVPFNLIYAPGKPDPVVLPELLTPARVLDALDQAATK